MVAKLLLGNVAASMFFGLCITTLLRDTAVRSTSRDWADGCSNVCAVGGILTLVYAHVVDIRTPSIIGVGSCRYIFPTIWTALHWAFTTLTTISASVSVMAMVEHCRASKRRTAAFGLLCAVATGCTVLTGETVSEGILKVVGYVVSLLPAFALARRRRSVSFLVYAGLIGTIGIPSLLASPVPDASLLASIALVGSLVATVWVVDGWVR
jgi:hypothetical protein